MSVKAAGKKRNSPGGKGGEKNSLAQPGGSSRKRSPELQPGKMRRGLLLVLLMLYSAVLIYWMFLGFGRTLFTEGPLRYNLVPLRTVRLFFDAGSMLPPAARWINLLGNVAVFAPFGVVLPLLSSRLNSLLRLVLISMPGILLLETAQMLLRAGSLDVDDLLLNLLGVCAGYGLLRLIFNQGR